MVDAEKPDEFVVGEIGPHELIAIFEQDDATGYLYLCEADYKVREALHVYNRAKLSVSEGQVRVVWSRSGHRCGVFIADKLRAIIGTNGDQYRPPMISLDSDAVTRPEWVEGFDNVVE